MEADRNSPTSEGYSTSKRITDFFLGWLVAAIGLLGLAFIGPDWVRDWFGINEFNSWIDERGFWIYLIWGALWLVLYGGVAKANSAVWDRSANEPGARGFFVTHCLTMLVLGPEWVRGILGITIFDPWLNDIGSWKYILWGVLWFAWCVSLVQIISSLRSS